MKRAGPRLSRGADPIIPSGDQPPKVRCHQPRRGDPSSPSISSPAPALMSADWRSSIGASGDGSGAFLARLRRFGFSADSSLSLAAWGAASGAGATSVGASDFGSAFLRRSEAHTSELPSLMLSSYAVFWL